jgi:hypothetical protein
LVKIETNSRKYPILHPSHTRLKCKYSSLIAWKRARSLARIKVSAFGAGDRGFKSHRARFFFCTECRLICGFFLKTQATLPKSLPIPQKQTCATEALIKECSAVRLGLPVKGHGFHLIPFRTQKLNRVPFPAVVWS